MKLIAKPNEGEYPSYAAAYIKLMPDDGQLLKHLRDNFKAVKDFVLSLPQQKLTYRHAEGNVRISSSIVREASYLRQPNVSHS